eukprot:750324-Hanusia_phi.AAC.2
MAVEGHDCVDDEILSNMLRPMTHADTSQQSLVTCISNLPATRGQQEEDDKITARTSHPSAIVDSLLVDRDAIIALDALLLSANTVLSCSRLNHEVGDDKPPLLI